MVYFLFVSVVVTCFPLTLFYVLCLTNSFDASQCATWSQPKPHLITNALWYIEWSSLGWSVLWTNELGNEARANDNKISKTANGERQTAKPNIYRHGGIVVARVYFFVFHHLFSFIWGYNIIHSIACQSALQRFFYRYFSFLSKYSRISTTHERQYMHMPPINAFWPVWI